MNGRTLVLPWPYYQDTRTLIGVGVPKSEDESPSHTSLVEHSSNPADSELARAEKSRDWLFAHPIIHVPQSRNSGSSWRAKFKRAILRDLGSTLMTLLSYVLLYELLTLESLVHRLKKTTITRQSMFHRAVCSMYLAHQPHSVTFIVLA